MLSVLVAKTVADAIEPKGIYDVVIELSQLPYLEAKHDYIWESHVMNNAVRAPTLISTAPRDNPAMWYIDGPRRGSNPRRT